MEGNRKIVLSASMDQPPNGKSGTRELGSRDFQRFLARLDPDAARASEKYSQLRKRLIRFCSSHNEHLMAEELADSAIDEHPTLCAGEEIEL